MARFGNDIQSLFAYSYATLPLRHFINFRIRLLHHIERVPLSVESSL